MQGMPKALKKMLEEWDADGYTIIPADLPLEGVKGYTAYKMIDGKERAHNPYWCLFGKELEPDIIFIESFDTINHFWNKNKDNDNVFSCNDPINREVGFAFPDLDHDMMRVFRWSVENHVEWRDNFPKQLNNLLEAESSSSKTSWRDYPIEQ